MVPKDPTSDGVLSDSPDSLTSTISRDSLVKNDLPASRLIATDVEAADNGANLHVVRGERKLSRWLSLRNRLPIVNLAAGGAGEPSPRRVRFSKVAPTVFLTLTRDDFSDMEFCSYWIQPDEMQRSNDRCWDIIDAYEQAKLNRESSFQRCTRGLESYIIERRKGKQIHKIKRENAYMAVLLWGRGLSEEERSRRYQLVSRRCMVRAIEYGRRDAIAAKQIYEEAPAKRSARRRHSASIPVVRHSTSRASARRRNSDADVPPAQGNRTIGSFREGEVDSRTLKRSSSLGDISRENSQNVYRDTTCRRKGTSKSKSAPHRKLPAARRQAQQGILPASFASLRRRSSSGDMASNRPVPKRASSYITGVVQPYSVAHQKMADIRSPRRASSMPVSGGTKQQVRSPRPSMQKARPMPQRRSLSLVPLNQLADSSKGGPRKPNAAKAASSLRNRQSLSANSLPAQQSGTAPNNRPSRNQSLPFPKEIIPPAPLFKVDGDVVSELPAPQSKTILNKRPSSRSQSLPFPGAILPPLPLVQVDWDVVSELSTRLSCDPPNKRSVDVLDASLPNFHPFAPVISPSARALKSAKVLFANLRTE